MIYILGELVTNPLTVEYKIFNKLDIADSTLAKDMKELSILIDLSYTGFKEDSLIKFIFTHSVKNTVYVVYEQLDSTPLLEYLDKFSAYLNVQIVQGLSLEEVVHKFDTIKSTLPIASKALSVSSDANSTVAVLADIESYFKELLTMFGTINNPTLLMDKIDVLMNKIKVYTLFIAALIEKERKNEVISKYTYELIVEYKNKLRVASYSLDDKTLELRKMTSKLESLSMTIENEKQMADRIVRNSGYNKDAFLPYTLDNRQERKVLYVKDDVNLPFITTFLMGLRTHFMSMDKKVKLVVLSNGPKYYGTFLNITSNNIKDIEKDMLCTAEPTSNFWERLYNDYDDYDYFIILDKLGREVDMLLNCKKISTVQCSYDLTRPGVVKERTISVAVPKQVNRDASIAELKPFGYYIINYFERSIVDARTQQLQINLMHTATYKKIIEDLFK